MADRPPPFDVTGTVPLDDPAHVAAAIDGILSRDVPDPGLDREVLHAAFAFAGHLYEGAQEGYLPCDMPYHDLRHALDAALAMARLVDGHRRAHAEGDGALTPELRLVAVLLALLHDAGFLRTSSEASLRGPQLAASHEARSVAFAAAYLATTPFAHHARLAELILATRIAASPAALLDGRDPREAAIACMLGTANLVCQMADGHYLERCYHHLYPEMVLGGGDRRRTADGGEEVLFRSAREVVARTPTFHDELARPRLEGGLRNFVRHLGTHFGGHDPYETAIRANLDRCARIVGEDRWDLMGAAPPTTTRKLDPLYDSAR